jgi:hypothetical protein
MVKATIGEQPGEETSADEVAQHPDMARKFTAMRIALLELLRFLFLYRRVRWRSRYYLRLLALCHVNCLFEVWGQIAAGAPLDSESRLYKDADATIAYYLMRPSVNRESFVPVESTILTANFVYWHRAKQSPPNAAKHFNFVRNNRLARIVRFYANLQNNINYLATKEIAPIQAKLKQTESCDHWKTEVAFNRLPVELKDEQHRPRRVASFLRKKLRAIKREIATKSSLKIDFTLSDVSAFIAISGALLLVLGFARVAILGWYFAIPFPRYFGTTDYIASGIGEIYGFRP